MQTITHICTYLEYFRTKEKIYEIKISLLPVITAQAAERAKFSLPVRTSLFLLALSAINNCKCLHTPSFKSESLTCEYNYGKCVDLAKRKSKQKKIIVRFINSLSKHIERLGVSFIKRTANDIHNSVQRALHCCIY